MRILPGGREIAAERSLLRFWSEVKPVHASKLFSPTGLSFSELSPALQTRFFQDRPGQLAMFTESSIKGWMGGDLNIRMQQKKGRLEFRFKAPNHEWSPAYVDLRLPPRAGGAEVCRVEKTSAPVERR